jgi:energy-converting hydrogenase B subunit Q
MENVAVTVFAADRKGLLRDVTTIIAEKNINIKYIQHFPTEEEMQLYFELEDVTDIDALTDELNAVDGVISVDVSKPFEQIYGKRIIVIGGGAQVAQVVLGAVSEADRHNIRGERISVDTIPLIGEEKLAEAVRAVGRLHRAAVLVLAGSLMGGEVTEAVKELREDYGIPVISLNMAGTVPEVSDFVVSDPVQAGVMAAMAIADTAKFDIRKVHGRKF